MPKKKTKKAAAKRFKVTAGGKVLFNRPGKSHLMTGKSSKRRRKLAKAAVLSESFGRNVRAMVQT